MNHVPDSWLRYLHISYLIIDVLLLGGIGYAYVTHLSTATTDNWALTPTIAILAGIHIFYGIVIYPWVNRRNSWFAMVFSQALFDFMIVALIGTSGEANALYWLAWVLAIGGSAMLGPFVLVAEISVHVSLFLLTILGFQNTGKINSYIEFFWLCLAAAAAMIGWLFMLRYYESDESSKLDSLNKLLKQEQLRSDLIIQSIADGVIVFNTNRKISLINAAACALTEWPANEAVGIDISLVAKLTTEAGKPIEQTTDLFTTVLEKQKPVMKLLQLTGRSGKATIVSLVISPIIAAPNSERVGGVAVFRDITLQRQEEQQRAEFISTASHEMRTPLAAIEGYLALALNDRVSVIDEKARGFLDKAHASTQQLGNLFQDLLTSSKAEDGRLSNHPVLIEMGEFCEKLTDELRFAVEKKHLGMEFVIGSDEISNETTGQGSSRVLRPFYYVYADPNRLREVITNVFDNAVKYTDQGKISIGLTGDNEVVQFYVRDTGPGIPSSDIPHLFQKFYRVDNSTTRVLGGTGLGLFICRKIVELYHGHIWVESTVGKGSTFFVDLPRLTTQKANELKATEAEALSNRPLYTNTP